MLPIILWGGNAVSWSCGVPILRDSIDRGVSVCPLTVTAGWSGGGGFGVCACATAAITHPHRLKLDIFIMVAPKLNYTSDPHPTRAEYFNYNVEWPSSES